MMETEMNPACAIHCKNKAQFLLEWHEKERGQEDKSVTDKKRLKRPVN